jgi:predicted O-linked N-acetylglucosamine transferase (SPINDLY family)
LQHAITLFPEVAPLRLNLGNAYKDIGEHAQALTQYRETLALDPEHPLAASNALFVMNHMPDITPQMIFTESKACGARFMTNILPRAPHANDRNPERPLKIGYVSGDFRKHPVQMYIEPVLAAHDTTQVQAYCYANHAFADEVTERIKAAVTQFRHIQDLSDAAVAELIRQDGIDILIDLSGHTSGNRLGVFARKPAPIQATWIGYGNTTGLPTMDYIIADRYVLPVEEEQFYTEKPLRLDAGYVCFLTPELPIEVNELPMLANGYPTFGCFNVRAKITPHVMRVWAEILKRLPHAKLHLKNRTFEEASSCEPFSAAMQGLGAKSEQLIFSGFSPPADYLAAHHSIDLMLDTFPYSAHTTARDALWMGVPMLTLRGDRWASHVGEGLLSTLGYPECIAQTTEEYIEKAVRFAAKPQALSAMRAELRPRLASAVMTQPKQFTRGYEAALRDIWRAWACNSAITP